MAKKKKSGEKKYDLEKILLITAIADLIARFLETIIAIIALVTALLLK